MKKIKLNKRKLIHNIFGVLFFVGFILIIGTVGALEQDNISLLWFILQGIISLATMTVGAYGLYLTESV